jgi:hypothetical protein
MVRSISIAAGILMLAGAQNASAQIVDAVDFTTTFAFTAGQATLPAGSYTIRPDGDNPNILQLTGANTGVFFETTNVPAHEPVKTEVVFKRFGNSYVLKDIYVEGSDIGAETMAAEGEKHMAKTSASTTEHHIAAAKKVQTAKNQ